jgi:ornithine cyclodeaminase/alanine dehydrogenase-like protein (mu-crystallin family)
VTLPVIGLQQIQAAATPSLIFPAVRDALIAHAEGRTQVPPPAHLSFPGAQGDCHVKAGYLTGSARFTVKVATGFYANPKNGMPAGNGVMVVLSAATGAPLAVLADQGWLTAWRTAAAGALISHALTTPGITQAAVLGTGLQARLQIEWLHALRPLTQVKVWGRRPEAARQLSAALNQAGIPARPTSLEDAAATGCVITATASTQPLAPAAAFTATRHITALGADMPGKNELPPELFAAPALIATDDHRQCLDHGDFGHAVRTGHAQPGTDVAVGAILREGRPRQARLSIADLTGVAAADTAVACAVLDHLGAPPSPEPPGARPAHMRR